MRPDTVLLGKMKDFINRMVFSGDGATNRLSASKNIVKTVSKKPKQRVSLLLFSAKKTEAAR